MNAWPHQLHAAKEVPAAIARGERRILLTTPTGGGKTFIASSLIEGWTEEGLRTILYTNRKMLVDQLSDVLLKHGVYHGVRAAGYEDEREHPVQISSIQTEDSRVLKRKTWDMHKADRVVVDEAHLQKADVAKKLLDAHHAEGAVILGLTATPLDLGGIYESLIVAGTTSELRKCGALVPAYHYGPDEPDLRQIKKVQVGENLTEPQLRKLMGNARNGGDPKLHQLFGRVLEWFIKLNPERKPTILFAPGLAESFWFAEQFTAAGISAAHIDGDEVWCDGQFERTSRTARADVLAGSKDGRITVLCNRFVLREGIDCPWLAHGIFATVFGSLQSYLQSGGRLLRSHPGVDSVVIQDHGGNWHRHGSLNADREWFLGQTAAMTSGLREERMRNKQVAEPACCPKCRAILLGVKCKCGFVLDITRKSRPVIQADGTLKEYKGDIYRPRRITSDPDASKIWQRMYYRAKNAGMTFNQARALFAVENKWGWPPVNLPLMPKHELDFFLKVADVPRERLVG